MKFLIVVDMQNDFVFGPLGSAAARKAQDNIEAYLKDLDDETYVIFTRDTHFDDYLETLEGKKLPLPHCIEHTKGWEIVDALEEAVKNRDSSHVMYRDKRTFGAVYLHNTILNVCILNQMSSKDVEKEVEIEFCGVCTDICVVSNALLMRAQFPNMKISVLEDLCAGTSVKNHEAALAVMNSCQIDVV